MMQDPTDSSTSLSLLQRLRTGRTNEAAWVEFTERYGRLMYRWCQRWGLPDADAQDVVQNTLLAMVRQIDSFEYDPKKSFRAWLKTVAQRCWLRAVEERRRMTAALGVDVGVDQLDSAIAREDLDHVFEAEARRDVLTIALTRVQQRVEPTTWQVFELLALQGLSGADVATRLAMQVAAVYVARSRVQKMIREEVQALAPEFGQS
jgi:RNA polymerase sigma factor (sigma-70 family)